MHLCNDTRLYLLETYPRYVFIGIKMCHFLLVSCSATVVKEREDERRSRGFGFVTFYESKHVEDAIYELNDSVKFCLMVQSYVREN